MCPFLSFFSVTPKADVAPLLAALLGVPYPVNSVGILPLAFLNVAGECERVWLFFSQVLIPLIFCLEGDRVIRLIANAEQLFRNFDVKVSVVRGGSF